MKTIIVGGGPAGLMAAIKSCENNEEVILVEKNANVGKKLLLTGNGRCNLTALLPVPEFLNHVVRNAAFLKTALYHFPPQKTVEFFDSLGLKTKVEEKNRVFPISDKSSEVADVLLKVTRKMGVEFIFEKQVKEIKKNNNEFIVTLDGQELKADKVILTCGGKSYSMTGSTGDGYHFVAKFGHTIIPIRPALCPIILDDEFISSIEGLSLKDVKLKAKYDDGEKVLLGDLIFTNNGISGPLVIWMSSYINRQTHIMLSIDIKPHSSYQEVDALLVQKFLVNKNKSIMSVMTAFAPKNLARIILEQANISFNKMINEITKSERLALVNLLKSFPLKYKSHAPLEAGFVTSGGIDVKEINPRTMESKIVKNLYFAGEIIDVDALSGGFSLQIAFATGRLVGG